MKRPLKLTDPQRKALDVLQVVKRCTAGCRQACVSVATLNTWLDEPDFREALRIRGYFVNPVPAGGRKVMWKVIDPAGPGVRKVDGAIEEGAQKIARLLNSKVSVSTRLTVGSDPKLRKPR